LGACPRTLAGSGTGKPDCRSGPDHRDRASQGLRRDAGRRRGADNTARLLDAKHQALSGPASEGAVAYADWQAVLRSVSALRAFQWLYHQRLEPKPVAELMLFRKEMPRSLIACHTRVLHALDGIAEATNGRRGAPQRIAAEIQDTLTKGRIEEVMARRLHDGLTAQIDRNVELGSAIQELYLTG